jgi:hypothetical protein
MWGSHEKLDMGPYFTMVVGLLQHGGVVSSIFLCGYIVYSVFVVIIFADLFRFLTLSSYFAINSRQSLVARPLVLQ